MKARTLALTFSAAAILVACDQPTNTCQSQRGLFSARLTPKAGSGQCIGLKVDFINLQNYAPTAPGSSPPKRDVTVPPDLAIGSTVLGAFYRRPAENYSADTGIDVTDPDPNHKGYSLGRFTSIDPSSELCSVPTLSPAQYVTGEDPPVVCGGEGGGGGGTGGATGGGGTGGEGGTCVPYDGFPKGEVTIEWKNISMVVRPDVPGTQFKGEVAYTLDGCKDEYDVVAMYPGAVDCGVYDADGNLCPEAPTADDPPECQGTNGTDITLCSPDPDPANGRPFGSGINPDFPIVCQREDILGGAFCVLDPAAGFPAIKKK